jgi:BASS family bile acid:Na+ symporter
MEPAALAKTAIVGSIALLVLSIGMAAPPGSLRAGAGHPFAIGRAMLAMFVGLPLVALALALFLPLDPAARTALLALAVSPMPPILPLKEQKAGAPADYALSIQVAASVVALAAAPMMALAAHALFGRSIDFNGAAMAQTILVTILVPLAAGIGVAAFAPALAARLVRPLRLGAILLLAGLTLLLLPKLLPVIAAAANGPTLAAIGLLVGAGLAIGHLRAGPIGGQRHGLALATAARHPGVAIGLATSASYVSSKAVVGVVLLHLVATVLLSLPYMRRARG